MSTIINLLYHHKLSQFREKEKEMTSPKIIYVTDLVLCPHRRVLRIAYPLLSFTFEPRTIMGDLAHLGLQTLLESMSGTSGVWRKEVEVEKHVQYNGEDYVVKGRIDLVYYLKANGSLTPKLIAEIKTVKKPPSEPLEHHVLQLQIYMNMINVNKGLLIYLSYDKLAEYEILRSEIDIVKLVGDLLNYEKAPRYEWECRVCPYRKICSYAKA